MRRVISTQEAPRAIGPYSQAIRINDFIFTSGQIPLNPETGCVSGCGIKEQTEQTLKNLSAVLIAAGSSLNDLVKTTCFLADMNDFVKFNESYIEYITCAPARSCIAVRSLPKDVLVEIEAIAVRRRKP